MIKANEPRTVLGVAKLTDRALLAPVWLGVIGPQGVLMMPLIVGNLADRLRLNPAQAGFEASAALTGACVAGAMLTAIIRTVGWRQLASILIVCLCAAYGSLATHPAHFVSLIAMFIAGLGMGGTLALAMTATADSPEQIRATGLLFGAQGAVGALLAALVPSIAGLIGDRGLFVLLMAISASALVAVSALPNYAVPASVRIHRRPVTGAWPALGAALVAWGAINFASGGFWPLIERIAVSDGQTMASASRAIGLSLIVGVAGGLSATAVSNRLGHIGPLVLIGVATIASIATLIVHPSPLAFTVALCIFVFVWNMGPAYQLPVVADADFTGRGMPLALLSMKICMAIAPTAYGLLADHRGYLRAGLLSISIAALSTVIFVAIDYRVRRGARPTV